MIQENRSSETAKYRVTQLHSWRLGNQPVADFEGLVTHHPKNNADAFIKDGRLHRTEAPSARSHGLVGGEIQELETRRTDVRSSAIGADQILLIKDFILEDSRIAPFGRGARNVDVPAPVAGYIGRVIPRQGLVDILEHKDGRLLARVRHLDPISVAVGDSVRYGQSLGTQAAKGLPFGGRRHVHMEADTGHYQHYANYVDDLVSGRLSIDPARRDTGIEPRAVIDDGIIRIGETSDLVRLVQQRLNMAGFRGADDAALAEDGIYRLSMQRAVLNYQGAEGLPQSGDLDAATLRRIAPTLFPPATNPEHCAPLPPYLQRHAAVQAACQQGASPDALLAQAEHAMRQLEAGLGRDYDAHSERMAASLACLARENGLGRIDHIVLSRATDTSPHAERVFVVQGAIGDPAQLRADMRTADALSAPVEASLLRLRSEAGSQAHAVLQRDPSFEHVPEQAPRPG